MQASQLINLFFEHIAHTIQKEQANAILQRSGTEVKARNQTNMKEQQGELTKRYNDEKDEDDQNMRNLS